MQILRKILEDISGLSAWKPWRVFVIITRSVFTAIVVGVNFGIGLATDVLLDDFDPLWTNTVFAVLLAAQMVAGFTVVRFIANSKSSTSLAITVAKVLWTALTWGLFNFLVDRENDPDPSSEETATSRPATRP